MTEQSLIRTYQRILALPMFVQDNKTDLKKTCAWGLRTGHSVRAWGEGGGRNASGGGGGGVSLVLLLKKRAGGGGGKRFSHAARRHLRLHYGG